MLFPKQIAKMTAHIEILGYRFRALAAVRPEGGIRLRCYDQTQGGVQRAPPGRVGWRAAIVNTATVWWGEQADGSARRGRQHQGVTIKPGSESAGEQRASTPRCNDQTRDGAVPR